MVNFDSKIYPLNFKEFLLHHDVLAGVDAMGFTEPTPIQVQVIPLVMASRDVIGCAQTGTGKTAAYLLPVIHHVLTSAEGREGINTLVLVPTRELAVQIDQHLQGFSYYTGISSMAVYGGTDAATWERETRALDSHTDIIIATPGRLISHLVMNHVRTANLKHLILDEADRMLDMGFYDDILQIISYLPKERQTLMFSATMPDEIRTLAKKILVRPAEINIAVATPAEGILEAVCLVEEKDKVQTVSRLLRGKNYLTSILIFTATKREASRLRKEFENSGFVTGAVHSDLKQAEREETLRQFRNRLIQVMIATNVLSRGIDIENIDLVINFNVPKDPEDYIHRIGRTARAQNTGVAITLVSAAERNDLKRIERFLGRSIYRIQNP